MVELSDNVLVAASGDQGDVEMFVEWLKVYQHLDFPAACMHPVFIYLWCKYVCCWSVAGVASSVDGTVAGPQEKQASLARSVFEAAYHAQAVENT